MYLGFAKGRLGKEKEKEREIKKVNLVFWIFF